MRNNILKGDIVIVVTVIIMSVLAFFVSFDRLYRENRLEIYQDGELIESFVLENSNSKTIELDMLTIEVDGEKVRVINSTCYDHVCQRTGYIEKTGDVIVCMPNRIVVKIVGENDDNSYDVVVG